MWLRFRATTTPPRGWTWTTSNPGTGTQDGGHTSAQNLAPLPRSVHIAKTVGFLSYQRNEDDTYTWTFPSGHTYVSVQPQRWATPDELQELDITPLGPQTPTRRRGHHTTTVLAADRAWVVHASASVVDPKYRGGPDASDAPCGTAERVQHTRISYQATT